MALQNLKTYFESTNINDFQELLKQTCVVTEKVQASSFHVKREADGTVEFFKSGSKVAMNKVDRTLVKYYENGIKHFNTLLKEVVEEMPSDWKFGFDYMVDKKTIDIEYDLLPKNNLILTHIQVLNPVNPTQIKRVIRDPQILKKWANKLDVQETPVVFEGQLQSYQKQELIDQKSKVKNLTKKFEQGRKNYSMRHYHQ
jgi:hypothetical protein